MSNSDAHLPAYLPPRRPQSLPNLLGSPWHISPTGSANAQQQQPTSAASRSASTARRKLTKRRLQRTDIASVNSASPENRETSRPTSYQSFSSGNTALNDGGFTRPSSNAPQEQSGCGGEQTPNPDVSLTRTHLAAPAALRKGQKPEVLRQSSLRIETRLSDEDLALREPPTAILGTSHSDPQLRRGGVRPHSDPASIPKERVNHHGSPLPLFPPALDDPWRLPPLPLPPNRDSTPPSRGGVLPKPRASFKRLSSLDNVLTFREEMADWRRASSLLQQASSEPSISEETAERPPKPNETPDRSSRPSSEGEEVRHDTHNEKRRSAVQPEPAASNAPSVLEDEPTRPVFRHPSTEYGFIFTVCVMQLLGEYLITGFAMELPSLLNGRVVSDAGTMGLFWPAALLTLILSATLLIFARLSDMYGGYPCFMFGVLWLAIWTLVPGFSTSLMLLNISRAIQGLAIAAYMPSTFALIGALYPQGPRRNFVLAFYSGCAPVGFFAGFLVAGALPADKTKWYFWTASIASFAMATIAYVSIPTDKADRSELQLHMDWIGAFLITAGLIMLAYALSVEPYVNQSDSGRSGFSDPACYGPLAAGLACLLVAFWYEGWKAKCPLLPFDFFVPKSVKPLALACLCFYASYGVWLYSSAEFFQSPSGVTKSTSSGEALEGIQLALWYAPTAIGGMLLCVFSGALLHIIPVMLLLLLSAVAWLAAPLLLALAPLPLNYWSSVLPSMLCATIGLDLTYTVSIIFFSSAQPLKYQGLCGAVASSLINLGMSFALPISEIAMKKAQESVEVPAGDESINWGFRATFIYAAASAGLGLIMCVLFVRISRGVVSQRPADEERSQAIISETTLVGEGDERAGPDGSRRNYA